MLLCNFMNDYLTVERTVGGDFDKETETFIVKAHVRVKRIIQAVSDRKSAQSELQLVVEKDTLEEYDKVTYRNKQYEVRIIQPEYRYFAITCYEI
ncbi:MAG: hypothetical protein ACRDD4_12500 [Culicoidibacterales bacterium]